MFRHLAGDMGAGAHVEFETVTLVCLEQTNGRDVEEQSPSVDDFGTAPWPTADEIRALLTVVSAG